MEFSRGTQKETKRKREFEMEVEKTYKCLEKEMGWLEMQQE